MDNLTSATDGYQQRFFPREEQVAMGLSKQVNVPNSPALTEPVIHSESSGAGQVDLKSVTVVTRENSQMAVAARTKVTILEVTNVATKALIVGAEKRSSVLDHFLNLIRTN